MKKNKDRKRGTRRAYRKLPQKARFKKRVYDLHTSDIIKATITRGKNNNVISDVLPFGQMVGAILTPLPLKKKAKRKMLILIGKMVYSYSIQMIMSMSYYHQNNKFGCKFAKSRNILAVHRNTVSW